MFRLTEYVSKWYLSRMDFKQYFYGLTPLERDAYARRAGTTARYIQCHLIGKAKIPRPRLMGELAAASGKHVTLEELLLYFYKNREPTRKVNRRTSPTQHRWGQL